MEQMTLQNIRAASPLPWRSQINFNGQGSCRMIDANNNEVPLLSIIAFSGIMTATIVVQESQAAQFKK
ncbi:hypothetical protein AB6809_29905 [Paraburkholderia sp. RCC_158]|uniref:hypothetical protein n=1 Tax=Paraburkholderia sp. RCC_158 TaxID=3239220 RepID=UPI003523DAE6